MRRERGFSLIELVLALGILVILSAGLFIVTSRNCHRVLHNVSVQLQADLRYAQRRSIIEGRRHSIIFDLANQRYHIITNDVPGPIRTVYMPSQVSLSRVSAQNSRATFLPRGTISGGFTVVLTTENYMQTITGTVSGGRIELFPIEPV